MRLEDLLPLTKIEARPYQGRIVSKVVSMFSGTYRNGAGEPERNIRNVLVESPTGSGKSSMGLLTARLMQENFGASVAWVAMRRNLLKQAEHENESKNFGVSLNPISMFERDLPEELLPENRAGKPLLMVIDEAQHDAANSMAHLHNKLQPNLVLGLTATPFRTDRLKLCFDKVVKDAGIHQLIRDGYLSEYEHYSIENWGPAAVAETLLREPERWGRSLVFFHKREECAEFSSLMNQNGIACDVVTADSDRDVQIDLFRQGHLQVLVNMMILTEGFDCPELETVFCRDSGKGCTMQMAGRVFRKHAVNGNWMMKKVVQSSRTDWPMLKTAMPKTQYVWQNSDWRSLTVNPKLNQINAAARLAIASVDVQLPKFLARKTKRRF